METRSRNIVIALLSIGFVVVFVISYFLFFGKNETVDDGSPRVNVYKYEISSDNYKYYVKKLDANKIGLVETVSYKCEKKDCSYANSLLAEGNITKNKVLIKDDKLLIFDYSKKEKTTIEEINDFISADFIKDGKYVLIKTDKNYYVYDVENYKLSSSFKTDLLVLEDNEINTVLGNGLVTIDNGKYGIINLNTGYSTFENNYDYIDCNDKICLFINDGKTTVYSESSIKDNALIQSADEMLYYNEEFVVYKKAGQSFVYNISKKENSDFKIGTTNYSVNSVTKDGNNVFVNTKESNKCYKYNALTGDKEQINCKKETIKTDIFVTSKNKSNFTITYGNNKDTYDLRIDGNKLYNNTGLFYDYLSIDSEYNDSIKTDYTFNIDKNSAYSFLNEIVKQLEMTDYEKTVFVSRWLPSLILNGNNVVTFKTGTKIEPIFDVNILTDSNSYRNIIMFVEKGTSNSNQTLGDAKLSKLDRSESSILTISGINY